MKFSSFIILKVYTTFNTRLKATFISSIISSTRTACPRVY